MPLRFNLASVLVRQGRLVDALAEIDAAFALAPDDARLHLLQGRILRSLESPDRAASAFEAAIRSSPGSREGYLELADLHQSRREFTKAADALKRLLEHDPDDVEALYFLGTVLTYQNALDAALEVLDRVVAAEPAHARAWFRKAHVEAQRRETMENARESYLRSVDLDDSQGYVWYEYGALLDKLGRTEESIAALERAQRLDPDLTEVAYVLGTVLSRAGRTEEAEEQLTRFKADRERASLEEGRAKRALASFARGRKLLEDNDLDAAIGAFLETTELNPRSHQGYAFLAKAHFSRGETPVAIAYVRRAIQLSPGTSEYPYLLSLFLRTRGDLEGALEAATMAVSLGPDDAALHNALGVLYQETGNPQRALSPLEKAVQLDEDNPAYLLNLATIYDELGLEEQEAKALARYREQLGLR